MPTIINSRSTVNRLADTGTSIGLNGNVGDWQQITIEFDVYVGIKTTTTVSITVNTDNTWTLSSGNWSDLGFEVGDTITGTLNQTQISTGTITNTAISVTVSAISGNIMTVSGAIFPTIPVSFNVPSTSGDYSLNWMDVKVDKDFTAIDLYYNQFESTISPTLNSFLDGSQTVLSASGLDATDTVTDVSFTINNPKSGGSVISATITGDGKASGVSSFVIEILTLVSGFYDVATDIENNTPPSWFNGSNNLYDAVKIDMFKSVGVSDAMQSSGIVSWAGNTGWFNENRNVNNGVLSINTSSLAFQDTVSSAFVTGLQSDKKTRISFFIDAPSTFFILADQQFSAGIITVPIDRAQFTNTNLTELQNLCANTMGENPTFPFGSATTSSIAGYQNILGAEVKIERYHFQWVGNTRAKITLDIEPNAAMTNYINDTLAVGDRLWALWVTCVDSSGTMTSARRENVMLSGQWLPKEVVQETLKGGDLFTIFPREKDYYTNPLTSSDDDIVVEDDFHAAMRFKLNEAERISSAEFGVELVNPSNGATVNLENFVIDLTTQPVSVFGIQEISAISNRPFQYVNGFKDKVVTLQRYPAADGSGQVGFEFIVPFRFRYEWWLSNTNYNAFYDTSYPLNNINNEWLTKQIGVFSSLQTRYYQLLTIDGVEYKDFKNLTIIGYRDAYRVEAGYTGGIEVYSDSSYTDSLNIGTKINRLTCDLFAFDENNPNYIVATISKAGGNLVADYVEITVEGEDGAGYLSQWKIRSDQTPAANNPLRPLTGQTTVKVTSTGADLTAECWLDTSKLPSTITNIKITAEFVGNSEGGEGESAFKNRDMIFGIIGSGTPQREDEFCTTRECDYKLPVFGSTTSTDYYHNDILGIVRKRSILESNIQFFLVAENGSEYSLDDNTFGTFINFGDFEYEPDVTAYQLRWKDVLTVLGAGCYRIKTIITDLKEDTTTYYSCCYELEEYSCEAAHRTVRVESVQNGFFEETGINFEGINWTSHLRFEGYFGNEQPKHESTMNIKVDNSKELNRMDLKSEFVLTSQLVPSVCVTKPLWDYHLMASEIYISDYNIDNHRRDYKSFPVFLEQVDDVSYFKGNSRATMSITFSERQIIRRVSTCSDGERTEPFLSSAFVWENQCARFLKGLFDADFDGTGYTFTVDLDSSGIYTTLTDDGSSGVVSITVNGSPLSLPYNAQVGDLIVATRTITTGAGWYKLS